MPYAKPKVGKTTAQTARQVAFDPALARHIALLLAQGLDAKVIQVQLKHRAEADIVNAYIREALKNPFFQGAAQLNQVLQKRSWILSAQRRAWQLQPNKTTIERRKGVTPDQFLADYYANQRPVILEGMVDDWPALHRWSINYIEEKVGRSTLIEAQGDRDTRKNFEADKQALVKTLPFGDVADHLRRKTSSNNLYVTANNGATNRKAFAPLWNDFSAIEGITDPNSDNDGFLWIGPKGTITPFHHDLTNNLLIQVQGRKKVHMVANWEEAWMMSDNRFFSALTPSDIKKAKNGPTMLTCTICPGDALFIPVGWWHHITSLDESYTVLFTNFVWPNGFTEGFPS